MSTGKKSQRIIVEQPLQLTEWRDLPRIELYMDQLIAILQEEMQGLWVNSDEAKISSSMVNNYVKVKLVPAPLKKRYERRHIASLLLVFVLKSVLSMQELASLLPKLNAELNDSWERVHQCFITHLRRVLSENETLETQLYGPYEQVLVYALTAFAQRLRAERLLLKLEQPSQE